MARIRFRAPFLRVGGRGTASDDPWLLNPQARRKARRQAGGSPPPESPSIAALAVVVIALAVVLFGGGGGHKYTLLFQNAGQLVPDNQVLIGGSPVGSVESIELTDDNLAEVHVEVDQQLHEGTTAVIRATSLSGVANHYVSISPGPNSNPALDEGATLGLASTTTPVDIDQLFNTFPPPVRARPRQLHQGQRGDLRRPRPRGEPDLQVLRPGAQPHRRLRPRTERRPAPLRALHRQLQQALDRGRRARRPSSPARSPTPAPPSARSPPRTSPSTSTPAAAAAGLAPEQHDLRQPPRRPRRPRTAGRTRRSRRPRTWRRSWPNCARSSPNPSRSSATCGSPCAGPARPTTPPNCWPRCRPCSSGPRKAFPHSEDAIAAFQPNLNFARAYTPDLFNGFGKLGQVAGYYDGNGHYVRASIADLNLFNYNSGSGVLEPITPSRTVRRLRLLGRPSRAAAPAAPPSRRPTAPTPSSTRPRAAAASTPSECNPADVPPGP